MPLFGTTRIRGCARGVENAIQTLNANAVQMLTATVAFGALSADASATSTAKLIGTIPAGAIVHGVSLDAYTPFTGGAISAMVCDVGSTGDSDALVVGANVLVAAVDGTTTTCPIGAAPNKRFAAATAINATFRATGANCDAATAGTVTIRVTYAVPQ